MNVTNYKIISMINALNKFSNKKLPQRISYSITRNLMKLQKEHECYNTEVNKLIDKYSDSIKKNVDGEMMFNNNGIPIIDGEEKQNFESELVELLNIEIEIDFNILDIDVFDYDDCGGRYDILTPKEIFELQSVLCE